MGRAPWLPHLEGSGKMPQMAPLVCGLLLTYLLFVRALRYRALQNIEKKFAHLRRNPYSMTYKDAHEINKLVAFHDFPNLTRMAGFYALVKSYGIARGTPLLMKTKQLGTLERVGKRMEDTGLSFVEALAGDIDGERSMRAISKVNWLHARYKDKISNDEMLHTLYITGFEVIRFIDLYGWRKLSELEKVALFVVWKEIGLRMGIRDIPSSLELFDKWTLEYQEREMYYAGSNKALADVIFEYITKDSPKWQHQFLRSVSGVFLEQKVRRAVGWDDPPRWIEVSVLSIYRVRAFMIRNFCLPRLVPFDPLPKMDPVDGRLYKSTFDIEPWYVKDTFWTRWSVWQGTNGNRVPGLKYKSNGFLPEELGPVELEKSSKTPVIEQAQAMNAYVHGEKRELSGCPFMYGDIGHWK